MKKREESKVGKLILGILYFVWGGIATWGLITLIKESGFNIYVLVAAIVAFMLFAAGVTCFKE